jgi:hypothetical protein
MKKLRIVLLPVALVLIGAGAAFATNAAKNSNSMTVTGYYKDSTTGECKRSPVECTDVQGDLCTWQDGSTTHSLYLFNGTRCTIELYKPAN